ncbi:SDR family NAD(P)-dependent oxidoreductase [Streptomyces coelicoflavus]|uniref:SDR family NAD(P)-dependent oxidoreductase n=1 Tax=Streptomyces coelicoflavus TaxID=285562 RepID=UPI0024ACB85D|nr:SDR family NAD(P)-dependent oxidoreductase [Streptomyces coelicoflavus]MDI6520200.1 SDR family NAD(P)-dependent oxidoreductase [Streptomyces coelicoflavus]
MRTALITGSGRREGLGFETAWQLAAEGFHVVLSARTVDQVEPLAGELAQEGFDASALELDLLDRASAAEAARQVEERFGRLDVLINNAAVMMHSPTVVDKDLDELMFEFQTNVVGTWSVTQHMLPLLVAGGHGRIVNVSSGAGSFWDPDYGLVNYPGFAMDGFGEMPITAYALTKTALNGLTIKMAKELKGANVLVNAVCPGVTATRPGTEQWARPAVESARGVVWAATLPDGGPTGLFFRDGKQLPW